MSFAAPAEDRWLEDYEPGSVHEFGDIEVEEAEVLAFGRRFDPQVFHTDPAAARETEYGGLIASGWHTAALMIRLYSDHYLSRVATLVSPRRGRAPLAAPGAPRRPPLHPRPPSATRAPRGPGRTAASSSPPSRCPTSTARW